MQVTCPNCRARYAVDPLAIGPAGRTVQCARCSHRWVETMKLSDNPAPPPPPPPIPPLPSMAEPTYTANLPAVIAPRPRLRWKRWLVAAVVVAIAAGAAAFAYRDEIRSRLPAEWRAWLGEPAAEIATAARVPETVVAAAPRLELDLSASSVEIADGRYRVRGELVNAGNAPGSTTSLKLVFRNGDDVLGERTYPLVEGPVEPGQRLSFSRPFDDPPDGTTTVVPSIE
ncbi:MAG: zinc-ribbon domain-containing protein [Reyranellaceae bacterium]